MQGQFTEVEENALRRQLIKMGNMYREVAEQDSMICRFIASLGIDPAEIEANAGEGVGIEDMTFLRCNEGNIEECADHIIQYIKERKSYT